MQVGCYTLDLYCDNLEDESKHTHGWYVVDPGGAGSKQFPLQYTGETGGECRRRARKHGWKLARSENGKDLCPRCTGKRP